MIKHVPNSFQVTELRLSFDPYFHSPAAIIGLNVLLIASIQMHGFPGRRTMTLRCELFGQAGDYALTLRPAAAAGPQDLAAAFIKVLYD